MKLYVQADNTGNMPHHFDAACALYGALDSGVETRLIRMEDLAGINNLVFLNNPFVGSVEFMREIFSRFGKDPRVPDNSNRDEERITMGEARKRIEAGETLFVKPVQIKMFTGMVVSKTLLFCLNPYSEDSPVIVCKPFESPIVSEWRCYVRKTLLGDPIQDIRCYLGDPFRVPDRGFIEDIFRENILRYPKSYAIDVAVLESGENVVVEYNDMWALGNYGMENDKYFSMLKERYFEIMRGN
jgi:hypothetical protein